jgi:phenylpropionate dioxygenase-like ring-hydroxylating dioxygenase large terminal subunit
MCLSLRIRIIPCAERQGLIWMCVGRGAPVLASSLLYELRMGAVDNHSERLEHQVTARL